MHKTRTFSCKWRGLLLSLSLSFARFFIAVKRSGELPSMSRVGCQFNGDDGSGMEGKNPTQYPQSPRLLTPLAPTCSRAPLPPPC